MPLPDFILEVEILLALSPEELGGVVLEVMKGRDMITAAHLHGDIFGHPLNEPAYPRSTERQVREAIDEAWAYLEREGLIIAPDETNGRNGFRVLSRRARALEGRAGFQAYRYASSLPKDLLHPMIRAAVLSAFQRGEYDTAVFQAYREIEVAVREIGGYPASDHGVTLARNAFHPTTGPLTDKAMPIAEREARQHLFAGALGAYKNPTSHRSVGLDVQTTIELIVLANHLLRIAESRRPT